MFKKQREFMKACDQIVPDKCLLFSETNKETKLWKNLIQEEFVELMVALKDPNIESTVHEAIDLIYVTMGLINNLGVDGEACFSAIHNANMKKKINGKIIKREDGKILKPKNWKRANLKSIIFRTRGKK